MQQRDVSRVRQRDVGREQAEGCRQGAGRGVQEWNRQRSVGREQAVGCKKGADRGV